MLKACDACALRRHGPVIAQCTDSEDFPNYLPLNIRNSQSVHSFKWYYKSILTDTLYISVSDISVIALPLSVVLYNMFL